MEEVLKEVLIKECGDMIHDKVIFIENLPKKFIFEKTVRMMQRVDKDGWSDGTLTADPDGEMQDSLLPQLEYSGTGDGGILFWKNNQEALLRLKDIDRYIEGTLPRDVRIPRRIDYAQQIGNPSSGTIPISQIPRIVLPLPDGSVQVALPDRPKLKERRKPELILPRQYQKQEEEEIEEENEPEPVKKGWTKERKLEQSQRMKKTLEKMRQKKAVMA